MEQHLYKNFKVKNRQVEVKFSGNSRSSAKEAVRLLVLWSTLYIAVSKCKISSFLFFYFNLPLFTQTVCLKGIYSWNFRCSAKEAVVLLCLWSTKYLAFWKYIVSSFYCFFFLSRFTQNTSPKVIFSGNFRCSAEGPVILLLSWSTLYIAFSKCKMSWF